MKKTISIIKILAALLMAGAVFTACTSDELVPEPQQTLSAENTYTLTVNATKGSDEAPTRALSLEDKTLNAAWAEGEEVTVYNVTKDADLTGTLVAQSSGTSTTLKGSLTGTIEAGDVLKLKFLSPSYTSQEGTLEYIAANCDYAEANVNVSAVSDGTITTTSATFTNQQAIVKFTLKNKADNEALNASMLTVSNGTNTFSIIPTSATDEIFVAMPGFSGKTVTLTANSNGDYYLYSKSGVSFTNSQYYAISVKMEESDFATPLTFEAKTAGATVTFTSAEGLSLPLEYSTDGITWTTYSEPVTLSNIGDKVSFRGDNRHYASSGANSSQSNFSCSEDCYIYGDIMSLVNSVGYVNSNNLFERTFSHLFYNNSKIYNHPSKKIILPATSLAPSCYNALFYGCTSLTTAPDLPATTMRQSCYAGMFQGCTSLTTAPELPATTLASNCYNAMFAYCTNLTIAPDLPATALPDACYQHMFLNSGLTKAPELPATTLQGRCYKQMFQGCTNLTTAPSELPATTMTEECCYRMFYGCTSLTTAPDLPATVLADNCYDQMFQGCTSLTTAPELPATTLAASCYNQMFQGCTKLTTAPDLPATTLAKKSYNYMFYGCTSLTTAPSTLPATTLEEGCYFCMFSGCSNLTAAPDLPAMTLTKSCYSNMFYRCSKLNSVECLATDISASDCTSQWLYGVKSKGTFTKASSMTGWPSGANGIPSSWTVVDAE